MITRSIVLGLCLGALLCAGNRAIAQDSADISELMSQGERAMRAGDFQTALKAWADAARQAPQNQDVQMQYAVLRQVVQLREAIATETDATRYETIATALRGFYRDHNLTNDALALDQQRYQKKPSAETAALLGETLLDMGNDAEAETVLASYAAADAPLDAHLLHAIALARQGKTEEAYAEAGALPLPEGTSARTLLFAARMNALTGGGQAATALVARALENTSPSALGVQRHVILTCPDFAALFGQASFGTAMQTTSKLSESKCSQAPSCGRCPNAKTCASGQAKSEGK